MSHAAIPLPERYAALVGKTFTVPVADGRATLEVIEVAVYERADERGFHTAFFAWVEQVTDPDGFGDDYIVPLIGGNGWLEATVVANIIEGQERLARLFKKGA
jgi:hypothetical protein